MKYFKLEECTHSQTAISKGIDNTPSDEHRAHIIESIETLLDPLRESWGEYCNEKALGTPDIRIASGYRSPSLNKAVGESNTSVHCCGYAFDLVPLNGKMMEFKRFCREFLSTRPFDQLISTNEGQQGLPMYIHLGYKSSQGAQRRQFLSLRDGKYFRMTE